MMKHVNYEGVLLPSLDIDGTPHALMSVILELIVEESWGDYQQILNSDEDLVDDLGIKQFEGDWVIPVTKVSAWLFTFNIRNMSFIMKTRFRTFRRDLEKSFRVAWALPVEDLVLKHYEFPEFHIGVSTITDIANIMMSLGVTESEVTCTCGDDLDPLQYIEHIASGTSCGPRGQLLCEQIQYIEDMPNGHLIIQNINEMLTHAILEPESDLDDYLDALNAVISTEATHYIGEL